MGAVKNNTAPDATAPWVMPGVYRLQLNVNGTIYEQNMQINMDPRVKTSLKDLQRQHDLSKICYDGKQLAHEKFPAIERKFNQLFQILENTEMAPTATIEKAVLATQQEFEKLTKK